MKKENVVVVLHLIPYFSGDYSLEWILTGISLTATQRKKKIKDSPKRSKHLFIAANETQEERKASHEEQTLTRKNSTLIAVLTIRTF